jgi:hypothetical protein
VPLTTQTRTFASWTTTKGRIAAPWNPGPKGDLSSPFGIPSTGVGDPGSRWLGVRGKREEAHRAPN